MNALFLLIPTAFVILIVALAVFFWAIKSGQYDDLDTEGRRILFDSDKKNIKPVKKKTENKNSQADEAHLKK